MLYCAVNGKNQTTVSVLDRGFAYGDGLFTTAKIQHGYIEHLNAHLKRLADGCIALAIALPDIETLRHQVTELAHNYQLAVLKIVITAGHGGRGYSRQGGSGPSVIVTISAFPEHYLDLQERGVQLALAETRLGLNPALAGIKHLCRLEQVMIRRELDALDVDDLLVRDINENVVETSCANLVWLKDSQLFTPKLTLNGVNGVMRQQILKNNPNISIADSTLNDVLNADFVFVCNSIMGVVPVRQLLDKKYELSKGVEIAKRLIGGIHA